MINILVFGLSENCGGIENVIMNYYRHIDDKDIHFDFLCLTDKPVFKKELIKNGSVIHTLHYKGRTRIGAFFSFLKQMDVIFSKKRYDIFWYNECSLSNLCYLIGAKRNKIKNIIVHSHTTKFMTTGRKRLLYYILHRINRLFVRKYATDYWSCSPEASAFFFPKWVVKSDRCKIIKNAIDIKKYRFNNNDRKKIRKSFNLDGSFVLGHVGRFHFEKNQKFAIQLCAELNKIVDTKLLLIGSGPDEKILTMYCDKFNVQNKVLFCGVRDDIPKCLSAMDAFVFPSLFEGLSVANIEAQASGLYVYNSDKVSLITKASKQVKFLSLKKQKDWVNAILNDRSKRINDRLIANNEVSNNGFDIYSASKLLIKHFKNLHYR